MSVAQPNARDRIKGAAAAVLVQAAIGYALIVGLATSFSHTTEASLTLFRLAPPPPPPPREKPAPPRVRRERPERAAAPPNLRSTATEIVAPVPVIPPPLPSPVVAALKPRSGSDATSGAADIRGPGTGSSGFGNGDGGGGYGDGDVPPRWIKGRLKDSDYPASAGEGGFQGTVSVRFLVAPNGRVTACDVTRSSGNAALDAATCRLIEKRYRYDPSRDAAGRPVPSFVVESHTWVIEDDPPRANS